MRHRIVIDVAKLDEFFLEDMAELYLASPACGPTNLKRINRTDQSDIDDAIYSSMAYHLSL